MNDNHSNQLIKELLTKSNITEECQIRRKWDSKAGFLFENSIKKKKSRLWIKCETLKDQTRIQFRFSKKATKMWKECPSWFEIYLVNVKSTGRFRQIVVVFLENLNCTNACSTWNNLALQKLKSSYLCNKRK